MSGVPPIDSGSDRLMALVVRVVLVGRAVGSSDRPGGPEVLLGLKRRATVVDRRQLSTVSTPCGAGDRSTTVLVGRRCNTPVLLQDVMEQLHDGCCGLVTVGR